MKRILSLCLVVMLLLSPTAFVFADEAEIPVVRIAGQNRY